MFLQDVNAQDPDSAPPVPFDQTSVPATLEVDDPVSPSALIRHVCDDAGNSDHSQAEYDQLPVSRLSMSSCRRMYEQKRERAAITTLQKKMKLYLDDNMQVSPDSPDVVFFADSHFLDYMMCIPLTMGFDAIIPSLPTRRHTFNLTFARRHWEFPQADKLDLGFDPSGRMMCIGTCENEDVWLAMVPISDIGNTPNREDITITKESTRMGALEARVVISMLTFYLRRIRFSNVAMTESYPPIDTEANFKAATNIL